MKENKLFILNKKKNIFLEYGKDNFLYLTSYEFDDCSSCDAKTYLSVIDKQYYLICSDYSKNWEHIKVIDPASFDKYSQP